MMTSSSCARTSRRVLTEQVFSNQKGVRRTALSKHVLLVLGKGQSLVYRTFTTHASTIRVRLEGGRDGPGIWAQQLGILLPLLLLQRSDDMNSKTPRL
jgi:hypothetical protein